MTALEDPLTAISSYDEPIAEDLHVPERLSRSPVCSGRRRRTS
jgi:hypothetical protein